MEHHFLYVEDDPQSCTVMDVLINYTMPDSQLTIFEDSQNFVERLRQLSPKPRIIFLDIHVTPYDGFEMLRMIRQQEGYQDIIIVALTASVMSEEIEQLQRSGFDGVLAKPINREVFPELLDRILKGESVWFIR